MNINDMLASSSEDLDAQMEAAAQILEKAAADQGIDLANLDTGTVESLLLEVMGKTAGDDTSEVETPAEETTEISEEAGPEGSGEPTVTDVFAEVQKRAAAEGVDLTKLSKEEIGRVIEGVASEMRDPEFAEKQAADAAAAQDWENSKLAMAELGKVAADAFIERINEAKIAGDDEDDDDKGESKKEPKDSKPPFAKKDDDSDDEKKDKMASAKERAMGALKNLGGYAAKAGDKAKETGSKAVSKMKEHPVASSVLAGTAAGYGAGRAISRVGKDKKAYIEEAALKVARDLLLENGIDPDSGEKIAGDDEVNARALEMLREKGYEI